MGVVMTCTALGPSADGEHVALADFDTQTETRRFELHDRMDTLEPVAIYPEHLFDIYMP